MVKNLFPTLIYSHQLWKKNSKNQTQLKELLSEVKSIQRTDDKGQNWSEKNYFGGYTSYGSMDRLDRFSTTFFNLEKEIQKHVYAYAQQLHWDCQKQDLVLNSMWVNVMPQGTHHSFHIHPLSVISGTFYVNSPKGSSPLQFEDPRMSKMMACPPRSKKAPDSQLWHYSHQPQAGEVVLFESWLRHQVPAQKIASERVSISFNYSWHNPHFK
ncbi:MAG: TIGR02466 family protein [Bdellovibrionales bacterium]